MYKYASTYKDGSLPKERTMILYYENRIGKRFDLAELYSNQEGKYRVAEFLGGTWENTASGKMFDVYTFEMKE